MRSHLVPATLAAVVAVFVPPTADAEPMKSTVSFNNEIGKKTADQPVDGVQVSYEVPLTGGELDGCRVALVESLYGRDDGAWGIFDIDGDVNCERGEFSYTSSGAWNGDRFHAAGSIIEGSGSGDFKHIKGRVAQLNGHISPQDNDTAHISYDFVVDPEG